MEEKRWEIDETWDYAKQCASGSIDFVHARRGFDTMLRDLAGDEKTRRRLAEMIAASLRFAFEAGEQRGVALVVKGLKQNGG